MSIDDYATIQDAPPEVRRLLKSIAEDYAYSRDVCEVVGVPYNSLTGKDMVKLEEFALHELKELHLLHTK